jgi:hypothetical protein
METSINGEKKIQLNVRDKENQFNSNWNSGNSGTYNWSLSRNERDKEGKMQRHK